MAESESQPADASSNPSPQHGRPAKSFSLGRLLALVVPLVIVAFVGSQFLGQHWEQEARKELEERTLARMLGQQTTETATATLTDSDGDLVADSPADDQCVELDEMVFSFIASVDSDEQESVWQGVMDALSERLGKPVKFTHFSSTQEQLAALKEGSLHVAMLNTGTVPTAVQSCGFVPVCTIGGRDGDYGYTMKLIVPAQSEIKEPMELAGHKITFTRPTSNSGFKAALVMLLGEYQLKPERDYDWGFSLDHEESIRGVAEGRYQAAPVAGDILTRVVEQGEVAQDAVRTIYESQRFPPATLGHVHNLKQHLREGIRDTLLEFDWRGTPLEDEFGTDGKFVPVSYKEDWAATREIDEAAEQLRASEIKPRTTAATKTTKKPEG